jgi:hypothetical protein
MVRPRGGICDQLFGGRPEWQKGIAREREVCWLLQHERATVRLSGWREIEGDCLSVLDRNVLKRFRSSERWSAGAGPSVARYLNRRGRRGRYGQSKWQMSAFLLTDGRLVSELQRCDLSEQHYAFRRVGSHGH